MKINFLLLFLLPTLAFAQLDRLRGDMSEEEFRIQIPEAKRDLEEDSGWLDVRDSINGITGRSTWRIYDDTVTAYRFTSKKAQGPTHNFPKYDSTEAHKMRESADALRRKMELSLGKPSKLYNVSFTASNPMDNPIYYLAEWKMPNNEIVRITLMIDIILNNTPKNNAPPLGNASEWYQLAVSIDHANLFTSMSYSLGKSANDFFLKYPALEKQASFLAKHTYFINDSALSPHATWKFWFYSGKFGRMEYFAFVGKSHGVTSVEGAYPMIVERTNDILTQGNKGFGSPDSLVNTMPKQYPHREQQPTATDHMVYSRWYGDHEEITFQVYERYGGKAEGEFTLAVYFVYK